MLRPRSAVDRQILGEISRFHHRVIRTSRRQLADQDARAQPLLGGHDPQAIAGYVPANARHSLLARGIRMGTSTKAVAALALNRFGLGPRLGSIAAIAADPRGALLAELDQPQAGALTVSHLPTSAEAFRAVADANAERRARQIVMAREQEAKRAAEPAMNEASAPGGDEAVAKMAAEAVPNPGRQIYLNEAKARIDAALASQIGFAERLVWFWSNH